MMMMLIWLQRFQRFHDIPKFDPHNLALLRKLPDAEFHVLVQRDDLAAVHRLPSLLTLKRDLRVMFVTYDSAEDFKNNRFSTLFPRGGVVVMDTPTLLSCQPGGKNFFY